MLEDFLAMSSPSRTARRRAPKQSFDGVSRHVPPKILKSGKRKMLVKNLVKEETQPYPCEHCHLSFEEENLLFEHEVVHFKTEDLNVCEDCGVMFATKLALLNHRRITHKVKSKKKLPHFKCSECGKTFLQKSGLRTHETIHTGVKPFKCEVCGLGFRLNSSLQRHMCKEHFSHKPFKCDQCGKYFGHNSDLTHHIRSVHATERQFVCQICDEKFTTNVVLMRHINIHFELKLNECKLCGAKFTHSGSLYNHMKVHSDERAYQCQSCGKSYKLKSHLKNHSCKVTLKQWSRKGRPSKHSSVKEVITVCEESVIEDNSSSSRE